MTNLSERLKFARLRAGLKQTELAERSGCKQATISKIERGAIESSAAIPMLAQELGCNAAWLAGGSENPQWANEEMRTVQMPTGIGVQDLSPFAYRLALEYDLIPKAKQAKAMHEALGLFLKFQDES